jgi:hypothetical protein
VLIVVSLKLKKESSAYDNIAIRQYLRSRAIKSNIPAISEIREEEKEEDL